MTNAEMIQKLTGALDDAKAGGRNAEAARIIAALRILETGGRPARRFRRDYERRVNR